MEKKTEATNATPVSLEQPIKDTQNFRIPQIPNDNYIDATPYVSWKDCVIDLTQEYPEPEFMLMYNQLKFFTTGDIVVFKGKPKKGKSHAMLTFITALLSGSSIGIERLSEPKKILYVDCEMHKNYTAKLVKKVHTAIKYNVAKNNENFVVMNLKKYPPAERERIIEDAIKEYAPDVVFIDGIKDLTRTEPNDQAEGKRIGEELKTWTGQYNCLIAVAIHENKKDENSRGAVGSSVEEISSEVWRIDRDTEGIFTASQTLFRYHTPIENLSFTMDNDGNIVPAECKPKVSKADEKLSKMKFSFRAIFDKHKTLTHKDLMSEYKILAEVKQTASFKAVKYAYENNIIVKNLLGDYEINPNL